MEVSFKATGNKYCESLPDEWKYRWAMHMDHLFLRHGLELCFHQRLPIKDEIKKPWTDLQVTGAGEQIKNVIIPAWKEGEDPTPEKWLQLLDGLVGESQQHQAHTMDMIVTVGRKQYSHL